MKKQMIKPMAFRRKSSHGVMGKRTPGVRNPIGGDLLSGKNPKNVINAKRRGQESRKTNTKLRQNRGLHVSDVLGKR